MSAEASDIIEEPRAGKPPSTGRQAAWNYLVFGMSKSSTLVMMMVLARLLEPADFGVFALALLVVNLFEWIKDFGIAGALVQSPNSWHRIAPTGLTLSVVLGVMTGAIVASTAHLTAGLLGHPELACLIRVLAIGLTISALSAIPAARLCRDLDFRKRLLPEFLGAASKAVLTIALAVSGFGVWSLVWGQLLAVTVTTTLYWCVARVPVRFGFDRTEAGDLVRFGIPVSTVGLIAFGIYNVDYLAIGLRLGTEELGLYTLAYRLPELIVLNLCVVIGEVLFSALSRLQHDTGALADHYLKVLAVVVALTAPISVAMASSAPTLIATVYGPGYAGAAGVLAVLSLYTLVYSASFHSGDVYKAIGRPWILTVTNAGKFVVMIGPIWWAAAHGIVMVAVVLLAIELLHCCVRLILVQRVIPIRPARLLKSVLGPIPAAGCMGVIMLWAGHVTAQWVAPLSLVFTVVAGLAAYILALRLTAPRLFGAGLAVLFASHRTSNGYRHG